MVALTGRMGRYEECRSMVEIVLRMDPDMPAAQTLHKAVQEATARRSESSVNVHPQHAINKHREKTPSFWNLPFSVPQPSLFHTFGSKVRFVWMVFLSGSLLVYTQVRVGDAVYHPP